VGSHSLPTGLSIRELPGPPRVFTVFAGLPPRYLLVDLWGRTVSGVRRQGPSLGANSNCLMYETEIASVVLVSLSFGSSALVSSDLCATGLFRF